jgi:hypothetical protein
LFKLLKVLETISASFAAKSCDRSPTTNFVTRLGQGETVTNIQYEILGMLATAERPDLVEPAVLMLLE